MQHGKYLESVLQQSTTKDFVPISVSTDSCESTNQEKHVVSEDGFDFVQPNDSSTSNTKLEGTNRKRKCYLVPKHTPSCTVVLTTNDKPLQRRKMIIPDVEIKEVRGDYDNIDNIATKLNRFKYGVENVNILRPAIILIKNDLMVLVEAVKTESRNCGIALLLFASEEIRVFANSNNFI